MSGARVRPSSTSPKTACVAFLYSSHPRQPSAASRRIVSDGRATSGMNSAAEVATGRGTRVRRGTHAPGSRGRAMRYLPRPMAKDPSGVQKAPATRKRNPFDLFLAGVEWVGNLLPHPVTLFASFALLVIVASAIAASFGVSVEDPRPNAPEIVARSLL